MGCLKVCNREYNLIEKGNNALIYGFVPSGLYAITHILAGERELIFAFSNEVMLKLLLYQSTSDTSLYDLSYKVYARIQCNRIEAVKLLSDFCKRSRVDIINIDSVLKFLGCKDIDSKYLYLGHKGSNNILYKLPCIVESNSKELFKGFRQRRFIISPMPMVMSADKYYGVYYMDNKYNDDNTEKFNTIVRKCELAGIEPPNCVIDGLCILHNKEYQKLLLPVAHIVHDARFALGEVSIEGDTRLPLKYALTTIFRAKGRGEHKLHLGNITKLSGCSFSNMDIEIDRVEQIEDCQFTGCSIKINEVCDIIDVIITDCALRVRGNLYRLGVTMSNRNVIKLDKAPKYLNVEVDGMEAFGGRQDMTDRCRKLLQGHRRSELVIAEKMETSKLIYHVVGIDEGLLDIIN